LADGRRLGYAEFGSPTGWPLIEFHGNPSSRLGSRLLDGAARELDVRVIGVDRPGIGLSDHKPGRTLLDWPDDVVELVDQLGIDRFSILGGSGGVPSTLACAYRIPDRLVAVGVLFGTCPPGTPQATTDWSGAQRAKAFLGRHAPLWIGELAMKPVARSLRGNPDVALRRLFHGLPEADVVALKEPGVRQDFLDTLREAFRSGTAGVALDFALGMKPWGFETADISAPVHLWHGEDDTIVPVGMGHRLAQSIPGCTATFLPAEGHFSLLPNHATEILRAVCGESRTRY
jgi:pimeloyl-ACP methyl ester carboxylesterase